MERNVLLVEAPGPFRDALAAVLTGTGAHVTTADDAIDALGCVDTVAPELVLVATEVGPPGCDAVCRIVRRRAPGVIVHVLADRAGDRGDGGSIVLARSAGVRAVADALLMAPKASPANAPPPAAPSAALRAPDPPPSSRGEAPTELAPARRSQGGRSSVDVAAASRRGNGSTSSTKLGPLPREEPVTGEPPRAATMRPSSRGEPLARIQLVKRAENTKPLAAPLLDVVDLPPEAEPAAPPSSRMPSLEAPREPRSSAAIERPLGPDRDGGAPGTADIAALLDEELVGHSVVPEADPSAPSFEDPSDPPAPLSAVIAKATPSSQGAVAPTPSSRGASSSLPLASTSSPGSASAVPPGGSLIPIAPTPEVSPATDVLDFDLPDVPAPRARAASSSRPSDPRLLAIEPLLARGAWDRICELLGPPDSAGELPPTLGLVYAIARKEAAGVGSSGDADALAIRSVAAVLGVGVASEAALVVAKRALRRNPATWRSRPAPNKGLSVVLIVLALALGIAAGVMGPLTWRFF